MARGIHYHLMNIPKIGLLNEITFIKCIWISLSIKISSSIEIDDIFVGSSRSEGIALTIASFDHFIKNFGSVFISIADCIICIFNHDHLVVLRRVHHLIIYLEKGNSSIQMGI